MEIHWVLQQLNRIPSAERWPRHKCTALLCPTAQTATPEEMGQLMHAPIKSTRPKFQVQILWASMLQASKQGLNFRFEFCEQVQVAPPHWPGLEQEQINETLRGDFGKTTITTSSEAVFWENHHSQQPWGESLGKTTITIIPEGRFWGNHHKHQPWGEILVKPP